MLFQGGPDANLSRFQGSSSISSAEYFGRNETPLSKFLKLGSYQIKVFKFIKLF